MMGRQSRLFSSDHLSSFVPGRANPRTKPGLPLLHSKTASAPSALKKSILEPIRGGAVVVREVDIVGFHTYQKLIPEENLVSIFMKVSDEADLRQRILRRGEMSDEELQRRMDSALKEIAQKGECKYEVENKWGEIDQCVGNVTKIVLDEIEEMN